MALNFLDQPFETLCGALWSTRQTLPNETLIFGAFGFFFFRKKSPPFSLPTDAMPMHRCCVIALLCLSLNDASPVRQGEVVSLTEGDALSVQDELLATHEKLLKLQQQLLPIGGLLAGLQAQQDRQQKELERQKDQIAQQQVMMMRLKLQPGGEVKAEVAVPENNPGVYAVPCVGVYCATASPEQESLLQQVSTCKPHAKPMHPRLKRFFDGAAQVTAGLKIPKPRATNGCIYGGCCGWGHRLQRASRAFVHITWNEQAVTHQRWGQCSEGQRDDGQKYYLYRDMFQDNALMLNAAENKDYNQSCEQSNGVSTKKNGMSWDVAFSNPDDSNAAFRKPDESEADFHERALTPFFPPIVLFFNVLLANMKPVLWDKVNAYMEYMDKEFGDAPIIGVHHRHGNGETEDFEGVDGKSEAHLLYRDFICSTPAPSPHPYPAHTTNPSTNHTSPYHEPY
jgi:hypothetical protein